jgi:fimbrial chaperone protein
VTTRISALLLFLCGAAVFARAGSLGISPVRIDLSERKTNAIIQVTNTADDPVTVQVHAADWRTEGTEDSFSDTNEVVVNPPVFTLAAGQKQIIRLGLRSREQSAIERSYRLILEEVPKPPKAGTIATVLRVMLPIFQAPGHPVAPKLACQARIIEDGAVKLRIENNGTAHDRLKEIVLEVGAGQIQSANTAYILPGGWREFVFRDKRLRGASYIRVGLITDAGTVREEFITTSQ